MNIGVVFPIEAADGVDDRLWLLACGGAIQVNQRLAMHLLVEGREICPDLVGVERRCTASRVKRRDLM